MSSLSFLITIVLNSISDSWLASISLSILSVDSSFHLGIVSLSPIICETLLVCFCFLNWSVLTPWVCGVNFYCRRPMRFSGSVSFITWTWCSWVALYAFYVGSLDVIGFWLLLGHSLVGPSLQLVDWGSLYPPRLVCCCAGASRTKPQIPGNKPTSAKWLPPPHNSTINSKWTSINKVVKRLRLL